MTSSLESCLSVLRARESTIGAVMKAIAEVERENSFASKVTFGISGNITVDLLATLLKRNGILFSHCVEVQQGLFRAHIDNFRTFADKGVDYAVLINFFDSLMPSFEARIPTLDKQFIADFLATMVEEIRAALQYATSFRTVFISTFHRVHVQTLMPHESCVDQIVEEFNKLLVEVAGEFKNVMLLELRNVVSSLGLGQVFDPRMYYQFKAPYTFSFMDKFAADLFLQIRGHERYFCKVLLLDCDNTLWKGIVGEDGINGISLSPEGYPGNIFWEVQHEILRLQKNGVLLALVSKNNLADVNEVIHKHPGSVIKDHHIVAKKVNWNPKPQSIRELALELNLGLDSFVFLDDSDFECNAVRAEVPQVRVFQVPKNLSNYSKVFAEIKHLFLTGVSVESIAKTEQYRVISQAKEDEAKFASRQDFLTSLQIRVRLKRNDFSQIPRISELTQKSNQFNLTTKRYSENEIFGLMSSSDSTVYSLAVSDKFGDSGLTGVCILRFRDKVAHIDSFLMSCRVIGRGVEFCFWDCVLNDLKASSVSEIFADFYRSAKNSIVEEFYECLGLSVLEATSDRKFYRSGICEFSAPKSEHIEVIYED